MIHTHPIKIALGLSLLGAFLLPEPAKAQLQELQHSVFGMDCAPCAYSLEGRIDRIKGVESTDVSLEEGQAFIRFRPDNQVTLTDVREAVVDSGFPPESAAIRINGTFAQEDGHWFLVSATGERFLLRKPPTSATVGQAVTVTGQVAKEKDAATNAWVVHS